MSSGIKQNEVLETFQLESIHVRDMYKYIRYICVYTM